MKNQTKEITWNIINSLLAGGLVFFGAWTTGNITAESIYASIGASMIVALTQFRDYWATEKDEYCGKVFKFIVPIY